MDYFLEWILLFYCNSYGWIIICLMLRGSGHIEFSSDLNVICLLSPNRKRESNTWTEPDRMIQLTATYNKSTDTMFINNMCV